MSEETELFNPDFLKRLRVLFFRLRKKHKLKHKGSQKTVSAGHTREFKDRRSYVHGDDYREIDWNLFARHGKLFIRLFEEIQEFHVHLILDTSGSMIEPYSEKRLVSLRLIAALAYLALLNQHRVSILSLSDHLRYELSNLKGQGHIHNIISQLISLDFKGLTDLEGSFRRFHPSRDRRGLVFIVSDLFGKSPEVSERIIKESISWSAETHILHVLDPREIGPKLTGECQLVDVESGEKRKFWFTKREMMKYKASFGKYLEDVEKACTVKRVNYVRCITDHSFEEMFLSLLARGNALANH